MSVELVEAGGCRRELLRVELFVTAHCRSNKRYSQSNGTSSEVISTMVRAESMSSVALRIVPALARRVR